MLYKEITDSADEKTNAQRPNRTNKTHRNESRRAVRSGGRQRSGEGGAGPGGGPQGRLAMSLSGGGPTGLGLLSLAFPSNIMTLVQKRRKERKHKTGLGLLSSSRERSSQPSRLQGPPQNALASTLQRDFPRSPCGNSTEGAASPILQRRKLRHKGAMRLVRVTQAARGRTTLTRDLGLLGHAPSPEHTAWRKQSSAGPWLCSKPLQIFKNLPLL